MLLGGIYEKGSLFLHFLFVSIFYTGARELRAVSGMRCLQSLRSKHHWHCALIYKLGAFYSIYQ